MRNFLALTTLRVGLVYSHICQRPNACSLSLIVKPRPQEYIYQVYRLVAILAPVGELMYYCLSSPKCITECTKTHGKI